jgi:hypothetical protein
LSVEVDDDVDSEDEGKRGAAQRGTKVVALYEQVKGVQKV